MPAQLFNYDFVPKDRKIVLKDVLIVDVTKLQYVNNTTKGISLYNYSLDSRPITDGTNIITLSHPCTGMSYTDSLEITYDLTPPSFLDRQILELSVPSLDEIVNVITANRETIISFVGMITANFVLNLVAGPTALKGDRIYIMLQDDGGGYTVTFTGNLSSIMCGAPENTWTTTPFMSVIEGIFDGSNYIGIDNC